MFGHPKNIPEDLLSDIKSINEERANMFSHLAGVIFWIFSTPFFIYNIFLLKNNTTIVGLLVYFVSFLMLFSFSTLYHSSYIAKSRKKLRTLDHISIYVFIAGSYTPMILMYVNSNYGYFVLFGLWFTTLFGSIYKIFFLGKFRIISTIIYLLMGWSLVLLISELIKTMPSYILYWLVAGGLIYTIGTYFYINKKLKYNHLIWHFSVFFGAVCHFIAIYLSVLNLNL